MTIAEQLLPKLNEWTPSGPDRQSWSQPVGETGWTVTLTADRVDTLGCLLWEVTLTDSNRTPLVNADLKKLATKIAARVSGLMETLRFVELDEIRNEALLRSETPTKRTGALDYYEVLMTGSQRITVRRYQHAEVKGRRKQIAFALTHESIAKFVDDLVRD